MRAHFEKFLLRVLLVNMDKLGSLLVLKRPNFVHSWLMHSAYFATLIYSRAGIPRRILDVIEDFSKQQTPNIVEK